MTTFKPRAGSVGERALEYLHKHGRTHGQKLADEIECERGSLHSCMNLCVLNKLVDRFLDPADQQTWYDLHREVEPAAEVVAPLAPEPASPRAVETTLSDVAPGPTTVAAKPAVAAPAAVASAEIPVFANSKPIVSPGESFDWTTPAVKPGPQPIGRQVTEAIAQQLAKSADQSMLSDLPRDAEVSGAATPERIVEAEATSIRSAGSPVVLELSKEQLKSKSPTARRHFDFGLFKSGRLQIEVGEGTEVLDRDETEALYEFFIKIHLAGGMS